uniref:restriction endonuclease subunit S n=1 Tax=Bacteroides acidifaciens TaxID=85831 RepID=UPI002593C1D5
NVPPLRFPEFSGEWERKRFRDVCNITTGNKNTQDKSDDGIYPFYVRSQIVERINSWTFDGEAILTAGDGVGVGKVFHYSTGKIGVHQRVYILSDFKCDGKYLYSYFAGHFYNRVKRMSAKNSVDSVRMEMIADMPISLPSTEEQKKIGHLLALLDERIATQNKIIEKYESLIQAIIYQKKTAGISKGDWQKTELSNVLQERIEKNINGHIICSVSVSKGVVNQIEYLGRSFAAKETLHYNVVKYGDIVYTKSPTGDFPYGIVKRSYIKNDVAVSPLYGVYMPVNDYIGVILHFYFMQPSNAFNYLHPLIQKGAKNTINITNERFLKNSIPLPKAENEAIYIANTLISIQKKIDIEKKMLRSYEKEKQYLLSKMFI